MADKFNGVAVTTTSPATSGFVINPNDAADQPDVCRAIYVGGDGDIKVDMLDGQTLTFFGVLAGTLFPIRARRVYATGTTATSLVALI